METVPYKTVLDMRLHRLELRLDRSWWKSKLRTETPDGDRLEIKEMRRLRAVRLFFHLTALSDAEQRRAEVAGLVEDAADAFDEAVGAAETYEPHRVRTAAAVHRDALSRLARLAGGGA